MFNGKTKQRKKLEEHQIKSDEHLKSSNYKKITNSILSALICLNFQQEKDMWKPFQREVKKNDPLTLVYTYVNNALEHTGCTTPEDQEKTWCTVKAEFKMDLEPVDAMLLIASMSHRRHWDPKVHQNY